MEMCVRNGEWGGKSRTKEDKGESQRDHESERGGQQG